MIRLVPLRPKSFLMWLLFLHVTSNSISHGYYEQVEVKIYLQSRLHYWDDLFEELNRECSPSYVDDVNRQTVKDSVSDRLFVYFLSRISGFCFLKREEVTLACRATYLLLRWLEREDCSIENLVELRVKLSESYNVLKERGVKMGRQLNLVHETTFYNTSKGRDYHPLNETVQTISQFYA